jgi:hypothetical protein
MTDCDARLHYLKAKQRAEPMDRMVPVTNKRGRPCERLWRAL